MQPSTDNVPFPFVLPAATLAVIDRLIAALTTLVHAVTTVATAGGTYTFSELSAHATVHRLTRLLAALVRLATEGPTPRRVRTDAPARTRSAAPPKPAPDYVDWQRETDRRLRAEAGWLLKALPDTAPAIAAELATLLADPALLDLLAAEPGLLRTLNPLLRSLGLAAPLPAPPPDTAPPTTPQTPPGSTRPAHIHQPTPAADPTRCRARTAHPRPFCYEVETITV